VFRSKLLLMPALLSVMALPVAPALAGEDPGSDSGPATLRVSQGCVSGNRAKVVVTAADADTVTFYLDGKRVKTVTPSSTGRAVISMKCSRLSVGAHRGRAVVSTSGSNQTLRFQITRSRLTSPRFTG
jgi:hypothetical protein